MAKPQDSSVPAAGLAAGTGAHAGVAIVGGGPAGLFAADCLAERGVPVTVYERMPTPGRKFLLAGRGGLNLTHTDASEAFLARYGREAPYLTAAVEAFTPDALRAWCHGLGIETFVGTSGRVFPQSFKASPVLRAWLRRLSALGVTVRTGWHWQGWSEDGHMTFNVAGAQRVLDEPRPAAVILALGGASWPRLGADGRWLPVLEDAGVKVRPLEAANSGFTCSWSNAFAGRFAGAPLKTIVLRLDEARVRGHATITAQGLEGGAVYALSRRIRERINQDGHALVHLDLCPDVSPLALATRLAKVPVRQSASNRLRKAGLPPVALGLVREVRRGPPPAAPETMAALLKAIPLTLTGTTGLERAISSAGGVAWDGLDDHLMVKNRPGLFVAGEMIDWEAPTGGYLLQACFATAKQAAEGAFAYLARTKP